MAMGSTELSGNALTVVPYGKLDADVAAELRPRIRQGLAEGARSVVFDLSNVEAVDSSGIGLLVATYNSVQKAGGETSVVGASAEVRKVLAAMRLDRHLKVAPPPEGVSP
jgi:anti-anti-sigma factor